MVFFSLCISFIAILLYNHFWVINFFFVLVMIFNSVPFKLHIRGSFFLSSIYSAFTSSYFSSTFSLCICILFVVFKMWFALFLFHRVSLFPFSICMRNSEYILFCIFSSIFWYVCLSWCFLFNWYFSGFFLSTLLQALLSTHFHWDLFLRRFFFSYFHTVFVWNVVL